MIIVMVSIVGIILDLFIIVFRLDCVCCCVVFVFY